MAFLLFGTLAVAMWDVRTHELVHEKIYRAYGCANVTVEYYFLSGYTTCRDASTLSPSAIESIRRADAELEIQDYANKNVLHTSALALLVFLLVLDRPIEAVYPTSEGHL